MVETVAAGTLPTAAGCPGRCAGPSLPSLVFPGLGCDGCVDVVAEARQPYQEASGGRSEGCGEAIGPGAHGCHRDRGADQGGYGVQAAGKDGRDPSDQDVTDRPAADGGDGPEDDGRDRAEPVVQGLGRAGDAEQAQPGGVEQLDWQGVPPQLPAEEERDQRPAGGY